MGRKLKKYIRLYGVFLKNSLSAQMNYKVNFCLGILVEFFWVCSHLLYLLVVWQTGLQVEGLNGDTMMIFAGTYLCLTGVYMGLLCNNLGQIPGYVRQGQLDLYLTKPVSSQFLVSAQHIDFGYPIPDFAVGIVLIVAGWRRAAVPVTPEKIAGYLLLFLMGCVWLYALQMVPVLLSFVLVKTEGIFQAFYGLHDLNKVPMDIYGKVIQRLGTFLIPIFPMVNYPGRFLTGYLKGWQMAYGILMPLALFGVIRALWKLALRKYTSANG